MPKKSVRIALAVKTPVYLPLYVAEFNRFYSLPRGFNLDLGYPGTRDGCANNDHWVRDQVLKHHSKKDTPTWFGVCDPCVVAGYDDLRVVGAVVIRAPFWYVTNYAVNKREHLSDQLRPASKIYTYPKGMTGYVLHERITQGMKIAGTCQDARPGEDITALREDSTVRDEKPRTNAAALTTDIYQTIQSNGTIREIYRCCDHPVYGDLLSSGIIVHRSVTKDSDGERLTTALLTALQRALLDIERDRSTQVLAVRALKGTLGTSFDEADVRQAVHDMVEDNSLFPTDPRINSGMWKRAVSFHRWTPGATSGMTSGPTERESFGDNVDGRFADKAYDRVILRRTKTWWHRLRDGCLGIKKHPWAVAVAVVLGGLGGWLSFFTNVTVVWDVFERVLEVVRGFRP